MKPEQRDRSAARLPPGQNATEKWPVLHFGGVPNIDRDGWSLELRGAVERPRRIDWKELQALPQREVRVDIHCVTGWSRLGMRFRGVPGREVVALARPRPTARHLLVHAPGGWSANLPLEDLLAANVLLAWEADGRPLPPEHGGPVRLVVPHLYFWKSAKWIQAIEFLEEQRAGFWERSGYHMRGDPWREERFAW